MKKLVLDNVVAGIRKLGGVKQTLEHIQEAYTEAIASMFTAFVAGASSPVSIHGCVNSGSGSDYNISAGAIYHNGEIFNIDAFAGTAGGGQVPVLSLATTWRAGDPAKYSDGSTFNTHSIRKYQWSFGASGSGLADFSAVVTLKSRMFNDFLDVDGALAALVDSAPGTLDTLNELAAALGDDPNFATSVATSIAGKVAKGGDTMTGALAMSLNKISSLGDGTVPSDAVNKGQLDTGLATKVAKVGDVIIGTLEVQGGVRTQSSGAYLKRKVIDIGDWNMDSTDTINVAHGLTFSKIRSISALIRNDANDTYYTSGVLVTTDKPEFWVLSANVTNVVLTRLLAGFFDSVGFDSTSFNRGWITIEYEA